MLPVLLSFRLPQRYNERFVYASSWEHKKLSLRSEPEAHEIRILTDTSAACNTFFCGHVFILLYFCICNIIAFLKGRIKQEKVKKYRKFVWL